MKPYQRIGSRDFSVKVQFPTFQPKRFSDRVFRNRMQYFTSWPDIYNQCKSIWQSKTITWQDHFNEKVSGNLIGISPNLIECFFPFRQSKSPIK